MKTSIRFSRALERGTIESGMEDLEDYYLASATLENVHKGKVRVYSAKEVRKSLQLVEPESPKTSRRG